MTGSPLLPCVGAAVAGAGGAVALSTALGRAVAGGALGGRRRWERTNHRGGAVTLLAGPAYAVSATAGALLAPGVPLRVRVAAALGTAAAGCLGAYDDLAGSGDDRGFRGHAAALRRGTLTTGMAKVLGIGATGLAAGVLLHAAPVDAVLAGGVIAGTANLLNLLDLRPGRATKAALLLAAPALARGGVATALVAAPIGAALALLPADLGERSMLGDCGANAMGALLGTAIAASAGRATLAGHLAALVAVTAASEKISFTRVIEATPGLRELDRLGRRPLA